MAKKNGLLKKIKRLKHRLASTRDDVVGLAGDHGWLRAMWWTFVSPALHSHWWSPGLILERSIKSWRWIREVIWRDVDFDAMSLVPVMIFKLKRTREVLRVEWRGRVGGTKKAGGDGGIGSGDESSGDSLNVDWDKIFAESLENLDLAIDLLEKSMDYGYLAEEARKRPDRDYHAVRDELIERAFAIIAKNIGRWWD